MQLTTVSKFGGSSVRDAERIKQICEIIEADDSRRFIVVSAPEGMTDTLIKFSDGTHDSFIEHARATYQRFLAMVSDLVLPLESVFVDLGILQQNEGRPTGDFLVSRGEYICAKIVAAYLRYEFLDAARFMRFNKNGEFDLQASMDAWNTLELDTSKRYVIPGFYGAMPDGTIKLFSRNASDFSAAVVAACAGATLLEKWTNESGIRRADPRIVPDAEYIDELTFREVRELTSRGTKILHPEVIIPLRKAKIPIVIKNVDRPDDRGTRIVPNEQATPKPPGTVVGISSQKGYRLFGSEKVPMETGFAARLLGVFAELKIDIAHIVDGVDEMGIVVHEKELPGDRQVELCARIKEVCAPDMLNIDHGIAIIGVVGHWMDNAPGTAAKVLSAPASINVSVEIIDQSKNQTNIVLGVADRDCDRVVNVTYDYMIRNRLH